MSPKRRHTLSSFQLFLLLLVGIAVAAVAAVMFAPRKEPPPPVSKMSVEQRPAERVETVEPPAPAAAPAPVVAAVETPDAPPTSTPAALSSATAEPDAFIVRGKITDNKSGQPLPGISVLALAEADPTTLAACDEALAAAEASGDTDALAAAKRDCEAARLGGESIQGISNGTGDYLINLPEPGAYRIWIPSKEVFPQQRAAITSYEAALGTLDDSRREVVHDVALELKSAVQGRVTEAGTSTGAPGLTVSLLDNAAANVLKTATTTDTGDYELPVDAPGDYAVRVELARSAYRQAEVVPFRRVKVTPADALVRNINFEVDPAGVVWGYITTPGGEPVSGSEVVLTTSESPLTQFVTAALRRTPPLSDRSEDDGYYELLGVPLNQEYQVFAQSASQSPQLADPFVLTPSLRSLRVDVYLFPGSRITGTVVDPAGRRIPEARIRLIPSLTALASPLTSAVAFRDAQADANGDFVIEEVPAGSYGVYAQRQGYKFDTGGVPVYPDGYSEMTGVNVTLYPIEAGVHDIFGVVRDMEGNGLSGVDVTISGLALDSMTRIEEKTSTSSSGEFRISGVPSGRYGGVFVKEGYGAVRRTGLALDRENKITMTQSALVRGRVLVRESNAAPPVYTVQALQTASYGDARQSVMRSGMEQPSGTFSNPDGSFELYLAPGDYLLTATSEGLTPGRTQLSVQPGATLDDVTIYVSQQGASIRGIVRTMDRQSPQGAVARLVDTSGGL
ncbi:MAG: hypothetical protein RLZZ303_1118, partial [Candidatus Hydrogenedentota bacterium]